MRSRHAALGLLLFALGASTRPGLTDLSQVPEYPSTFQPETFGEGVLSVGEIYRGSFSSDGQAFYFFKSIGGEANYRLFVSRRTGRGWGEPRRLDLGGDFSDLYPSIAKDGARLVFSSYRPIPGGAPSPNAHLWYVDRRGDGWGPPVFMAKASTPGHYHSWVEIGFDGRVYFRRATPDFKVNQTLVTRWNGREYEAPDEYEAAERWKTWRADVRVAGGSPGPDGNTVFLDVATRHPVTGRAASDIWVSSRQGDRWTDPRPLGGGVNRAGFDVFPFFSPDGQDLYFVRDFTTFHRLPLRLALTTPPAVALRYVANAGALVSLGDEQVLIDAPIREGLPPYATSDATERDRLERALPPYDRISAVLVTHWHEDHFSAAAVAAHLAHNPRAVLISSPEIVDRVRAAAPTLAADRFRGILPAPGAAELVRVGALPIRVLGIRHNPARRLPEQHVGFLIGDAAAVLHTGDADPAADNFTVLRGLPPVDLALLPFWYLANEQNRAFVSASISPRRIAAMHLPPTDADDVRREYAGARVGAALLVAPASDIPLPP